MTQVTHLPGLEETAEFFGELLGIELAATECTDFDASNVVVFAEFTDNDQATQHFICCDLPAAAFLGAALTSFPPSHVTEAVSEGELPENLLDNVKEILNISVNLFPQSQQHRIVIDNVVTEAASEAYVARESIPEIKIQLTSDKYGTGVMIIGAT
jgi:hypothetical protein